MTVEYLAKELHKTYRAARQAFRYGPPHAHGFTHCSEKAYFTRRAQAILDQAPRIDIATLPPAPKWPVLTLVIPSGYTLGADWVMTRDTPLTEDVVAYNEAIRRWRDDPESSRAVFYQAQRQTLEVVGLAVMRAARHP